MVRVVETGAVYGVHDGRARYAGSMDVVEEHAPAVELEDIDAEYLATLRAGPLLPPPVHEPTTSQEMRVFLCRTLTGRGVEFGAGARPFLIPPAAEIRYADRFASADFAELSSGARGVHLDRFVDIDLEDDIVSMSTLADNSEDFILAAHVIEHVGNPLQVFASAAARLRDGGSLVLVVPDRDRTFDRHRPVTSLDRLVLTFFVRDRKRELDGYFEYLRYVEHLPESEAAQRAVEQWATGVDVHLHTFTYDSFDQLAKKAAELFGFSSVWSHPGHFGAEPENSEFYFVLTK